MKAKVTAQPKWMEILEQSHFHALKRLAANNELLMNGSDKVLIHPAFEKISDDEIVSMAEDILVKHQLTPKLQQIEEDNRSKIGPRSIAKNWVDRKDSLYEYFAHDDYDPGGFDVKGGDLRPASLGSVMDNLLRASSAGLPYMERKGNILDQVRLDWQNQVGVFPCVLYTRTAEQGKTRNVWGYPVSDTIWEQMFYMPMLQVEMRLPHRSALIGPDEVDRQLTYTLMSKQKDELVYCIDFSSFDASVRPVNTYSAFLWMASLFQKEYHEQLYDLYRRFVTIGIHTPDGDLEGPHGVPSGSSFTNLIDSAVQFELAGERRKCHIQGDDGVYLVSPKTRDEMNHLLDLGGLTVNEEKSDTFEDKEAVYLQRYYHPDYRSREGGLGGVYSLMRAVNRIKYLEKWTDLNKMEIDGSDFFAIRTITILENCKHHPGFEDLVRLMHKLDKQDLAYTKQGLVAYSKAQESRARAGVWNQYGLIKGIDRFETVKILKTL